AVIMSQNVVFTHLQMLQQSLLQVSLDTDAIVAFNWLSTKAKAQHISSNNKVILRQRRPDMPPIPTGGRKTMHQQQSRLTALTSTAIKNTLTIEVKILALRTPLIQR